VSSAELEKHPVQTPNPHDEPSAEWGWHGTLPKGAMIGGVFVTLVLFGMLIGNHRGHVEDIYLVLTGLLMAFLLVMSIRRRRRVRR
jgi:hypothetical protein